MVAMREADSNCICISHRQVFVPFDRFSSSPRKKGGRGEGLFMLISASAAELEILFSQLHITMQLTGI